ncbi:MAG: metallophosphoesterase [Clostridiales bacterium]|nr:metallophosphoesterase [Clostridiales bacterium]
MEQLYKDLPPLKVQVITDIHYYSRTCGTEGKAYEKAESKSQKVIKDSDLVLDAVWDMLCADTSTDIVLLSGDTTKDGELASHAEVIERLRELKKRGKRVYVIVSTHDYKPGGVTVGYEGDHEIEIPAAKWEDMWDMYYEFGPNEAIATHRESNCYVVQLCEGYRLLALNDDHNDNNRSGFSTDCTKWILEQIKDARENGQYIVAMTHHPMLSPSPFYTIIGGGNLQQNHMETVELFADAGLNCMLTGHTHIHDISEHWTKRGNVFYDVATACIIGYPPTMRDIVFDPANSVIHASTRLVEEVPGLDTGGKSFPEYIKGFFIGMAGEVLWAAGNDIDRLAEMTDAFSVPGATVKRFGWLIKPLGKLLNGLTVGRVGNWTRKETGLKKSDYADIKDRKVVDFIMELAACLYAGDAPYHPGTNEYKITIGFLNILDSLLNTVHFKIGKVVKGADSVRSLVEPLLYNAGPCDAEADLTLYPLNAGAAPSQQPVKPPAADTVRPSSKGHAVLICFVLCLLVLLAVVIATLPVTIPVGLIAYLVSRRRKKKDDRKQGSE